MNRDGYDRILDALDHIDPRDVDYDGWDSVGMSLKYEGYDVGVWCEWSRRDPERYHEGECEKKWKTFGNNTGEPVTGGTIVHMAMERGWKPEREHRFLDWNDPVGGSEAKEHRRRKSESNGGGAKGDAPDAIIDDVEYDLLDEGVEPMYPPGNEARELREFLAAMFRDDEHVGYSITGKAVEGGRIAIDRGIANRTAGEIEAELSNGVENALGTVNPETGAWIRVNPLDGEGIKNVNVTDFRHALVESDDMPIGKFAAIVRRLNLPVTALVHSGNKSLHALVRIDAADAREYNLRVRTLYARCKANRIEIDEANKNPSRLCRMPGVMRGSNRQYLVGLAQGAKSWAEWDEWYNGEADELPDAETLDIDPDGERPELPEPLIEGVLRTHDKMLFTGPSKAGKSFGLMELCAAFATGGRWLGWKCKKSRVLYVNLELTPKSCRARFYDVFGAVGAPKTDMVSIWDMKGRGGALSRLSKALARRVRKTRSDVIVIDPIYKVMMGDENNARDISEFTNTLDAIVEETGCSLIYCHHHSKGFQGEKRSIDRASGSGVFGRDADAIVDMIELDATDEMRTAYIQKKQCAVWMKAVEDAGKAAEWASRGRDVEVIESSARSAAKDLLPEDAYDTTLEEVEKIGKRKHALSAWKVDATLREFEKPEPVHVWFDWPVHVIDLALSKAKEAGAEPPKKAGSGNARESATTAKKKNKAIAEAVQSCVEDCVPPTRANVLERLRGNGFNKPKKDTFNDWTKNRDGTEWCEWKCQERDGEYVLVNVSKGAGDPG